MIEQNQYDEVVNRLYEDTELQPRTLDEVTAQETFATKLQRCRSWFGKPFRELERGIQSSVVLRRLQQLVNTLCLNPLWRDRLKDSGFSGAPRDFQEWQQLPITDRETLNALYLGKREGLVVPLDRGGFQVIASGGTSGGLPIETVYSIQELHDTYEIAGEFLGTFVLPSFLAGATPRWIITTLHDYEMWSSGSMIGGLLQRTPNVNFIAAGPMGPKVYGHVMSFAGPKAIMGMSREIEGLRPLGENLSHEARESLRLAIYGSGIIQNKKIEQLKSLYPNLEIISYFASNQAEAIGMQLRPDGFLTSVPGLHLIEIVDANGCWVQPGEEGELLVTRLHAKEAPIIRMQLGDRMIRRPDLCSSSLVAEQFEFAGRSSDIIHLGESHYSATVAYAVLCSCFERAGVVDMAGQAHEVQFQNDRKEKILRLVIALEQADERLADLRGKFNADRLRSCFIEALGKSLSLFDQTEDQFQALGRTTCRFDVKFVALDSTQIYRTAVGKVPLIKDSF